MNTQQGQRSKQREVCHKCPERMSELGTMETGDSPSLVRRDSGKVSGEVKHEFVQNKRANENNKSVQESG